MYYVNNELKFKKIFNKRLNFNKRSVINKSY